MGEVSIDKLSLEISGNADKAVKSVDKLTACLEKLKKSIENCKGLNTVSQQIEKLSAAANRMQGGKIKELSEYIDKLSLAKPPSFAKLIGQIEKLSAATSGIGGVESFAQKISDIVDAVKPLETIEKANLGSVVSFLKKIPEFTKSIDAAVLKDFKNYIEQITESLKPLTAEVRKSEKGLESLNGIMQSVVAENGNLASDNAVSVKSYTTLSSVLKDVKVKILACSYAAYNLAGSMYSWFKESNDYIENLNLFTVAMGNASEEALNYAEKVSDALGIDMSEWIRNQGVFKQVTSGFGVASEASNLMSKNLTQLGYDISSFFNIDIDESMQKLQSGISGEIEPLRRLGYALDTATLQQVAYNLGITQNINSMTQAQKSQLRYIAIMQQSTNAMGDMARTVATPANSIRILEQQFTQLKRALGNIVSVVAVKLIPYIQVAIRLLTDLAEGLAKKWGFEMPAIDYSGMGDGLSTVTDEADSAAESVQETVKEMQRLAGFDEINVLSSGDTGGSETGGTVSSNDLGLALPEYDFLEGLDKQTDELYKRAKKKLDDIIKKFRSVKEWIDENKKALGLLATALMGLWAVTKVKKLIDKVKELWKWFKDLSVIKKAKKWLGSFMEGFNDDKTKGFFGRLNDGFRGIRDKLSVIQKIGIGSVFGTIGGIASYNFFHRLSDGTLTWQRGLAEVAISLGSIGAAFALGGPIAGGIAIVGTLVGTFWSLHESAEKARTEISGLYDNGGVKISDVTDLFSEQYDKVIETSQKIEEYKQTISDNDGTISTAIENVENFNTAFGDGKNAMSEEDLEYITNQFETIAQSVKDNVGTATQGILGAFSDKIGEVAKNIGVDLDSVITNLKGFESEMKSNVDKAETTVTDYQQMIFDGITPTDKQTAEYERAYKYLIDKTRSQSTELSQAKEEMQNAIDFSKLDFENPETFEASMKTLNTKAKEALKAAENTYEDSNKLLEEYFTEIQLQYKYGFITDKQYDLAIQTYKDTKELLKADMEQSKKDIKTDLATLTGAVQSEYNKAVDEMAAYKTELFFKSNGKSVEEVKRNNKELWDAEFETQKHYVSRIFGDLQSTIDIATKDLDISPDIELGESWLLQMSERDKLVLPSVMAEESGYIGLINENRIRHMSYGLEQFDGISKTKWEEISAYPESVFNNVDLTDTGKKVFTTLAQGLSDGSVSVIDIYNGILGKSEEFSVQMMNAYNDAVPKFRQMFSTVSKMTGIGALEGMGNMVIDFIDYTAVGRRIAGLNKIAGFATGGFPDEGQLFIANENGPEMVGQIGSRTAVANQGQITDAIYMAVLDAMRMSGKNTSQGQGDVHVYIDSDEVSARVEQRQYARSKRLGG